MLLIFLSLILSFSLSCFLFLVRAKERVGGQHLLGACCFRKGRLGNKLMMLKAYQVLKRSGLQHYEDDFFFLIFFFTLYHSQINNRTTLLNLASSK